MTRLRHWLFALAGVAISAAAVWGLLPAGSERKAEQPVAETRRISNLDGQVTITLSGETQRAAGLETMVLRHEPYHQQLRAYGTVLDLEALTNLGNGYVAALSARRVAQARLAASKPAFERTETLYRFQGASAAQAQAAEATFRADDASVAAADSQLSTLAATAQQGWGPVLARGLIERTPMFVGLVERREILLQVTLPPGTMATGSSPAFAELVDGNRAPLAFVSPATKTDPRIQGLSFFYTAAADPRLLPGMSVVVFVASPTAIEGVVAPDNAIVWWQGRAWIYLKAAPDRFVRRQIPTSTPTPKGGYVVPQLADGSEVVTQGAQILLSEEQTGQTPAGDDDR